MLWVMRATGSEVLVLRAVPADSSTDGRRTAQVSCLLVRYVPNPQLGAQGGCSTMPA